MTSNPYRPLKVLSPETKARIQELEQLNKWISAFFGDKYVFSMVKKNIENRIKLRLLELKTGEGQ